MGVCASTPAQEHPVADQARVTTTVVPNKLAAGPPQQHAVVDAGPAATLETANGVAHAHHSPPPAPPAKPPEPVATTAPHDKPSLPAVGFQPDWGTRMMTVMPLGVAIVSSDAREVLWSSGGTDKASCQFLKKCLLFKDITHGNQGEGPSERASSSPPPSFLTALLGPRLEAQALRSTQEGRPWKGTVSYENAQNSSTSDNTASDHGPADLDSSGQNAVVVQPPKTSAVAPQQRTTTSPQPSAVVLQPPQTNNAVPQPSPAKPPKRPLPHMPQPDLPICQSAPQPNTAMLHPRDIPSPSIHAPKSRPHKAAPPALMSHPSDAIFNARDLSECVWQESQPSALGLPGSQHYHPLPGPAQYDETKQSGSQPSQTIINSSFGTENLSNQNAMVMQRGSSSGVNTQKDQLDPRIRALSGRVADIRHSSLFDDSNSKRSVRFGGSSQVTGPGNDEQPLSPQKSWKKRMSQGSAPFKSDSPASSMGDIFESEILLVQDCKASGRYEPSGPTVFSTSENAVRRTSTKSAQGNYHRQFSAQRSGTGRRNSIHMSQDDLDELMSSSPNPQQNSRTVALLSSLSRAGDSGHTRHSYNTAKASSFGAGSKRSSTPVLKSTKSLGYPSSAVDVNVDMFARLPEPPITSVLPTRRSSTSTIVPSYSNSPLGGPMLRPRSSAEHSYAVRSLKSERRASILGRESVQTLGEGEEFDYDNRSLFSHAGEEEEKPDSGHDRQEPTMSSDQYTDEPVWLQSFDVTITVLEPAEGSRSPLMVLINNSTTHMRARQTFLSLAESQLALLSSIMPQHAIQFLSTENPEAIAKNVNELAREHSQVTLMFMDIQGFTTMSKSVRPGEVMGFLNTLFSMFDKLVDEHGVHKVETAGDCYIVSGGIMAPQQSKGGFGLVVDGNPDPVKSARRVLSFSKALLEVAKDVTMPHSFAPVKIRVGLHTGDVVSGLIGTKLPKLGIFGDAMNTASRMESTGTPGRIQVSETTYKLLPDEQWEPTGGMEVKGKGIMKTFFLADEANTRCAAFYPSIFQKASQEPSPFLAHTRVLLKHTRFKEREAQHLHH